MAKKQKGPTIPELQSSILGSLKDWRKIRRHGTTDPGWADGANMNLVRNHVLYYQRRLRELCKVQKVRPCPVEAKIKPPKEVSNEYCAPKSKAGPCRERRAKRKRSK